MVDQAFLNLVVLILWSAFVLLAVLKVSQKLSGRKLKRVAFVSVGFSALGTMAVHAPAPVYAQASDIDSWKDDAIIAEGSSTTIATTTTTTLPNVVQSTLPQITQAPIENAQTPTLAGSEKYVVVAGDNLWSIAKAHARQGEDFVELWAEMISLNAESLKSKNPNLIFPGEEIIIRN